MENSTEVILKVSGKQEQYKYFKSRYGYTHLGILAMGKLRQEDQEFKAKLGYLEILYL